MTQTQKIQKTSAPMSEIEARKITDQINQKSSELWPLLKEAHEREAWSALGYKNWRDYAVAEFDVSQSHAYRMLDQATVVTAIQKAANSPVGEISERAARDIKPKLAKVVQEIKEKVDLGADPVKTTYEVIEATRIESKPVSKIIPRPVPAVSKADKNAPTIESLQAENAQLREELHEARHVASNFAKEIESFESASGDVKAAAKELTTLKGQLETVASQRDQWMTTCSELRKEVTSLRKKLERMEKAK